MSDPFNGFDPEFSRAVQACEATVDNGGDAPVTPATLTFENGGSITFEGEPCKMESLFTGDTSTEPMLSPNLFFGLDQAFLQVREFHKAFGHPVADAPTPLPRERREVRASWLHEEATEFEDAETLVDQVDACLDGIYFNLGNLVELGVLPQSIMDIVHGANMGKMHLIDGEYRVVKNEVGKVVKPDNWQRDFAPEGKITQEVSRQDATGLLRALTA
jgi:predicted HAD superfamily Cof-like phosphohydrolase